MKKIAVVSDIHAGSSYALLPPDAHYGEIDYPQSSRQKYLWELWQRHCETIAAKKPDYIVVNGDVVDGDQWRSGAREVRTAMKGAQVSWANDILNLLPNVPRYYIHGTPYHDGVSGEECEAVAKADPCAIRPPRGYGLAGQNAFHLLDLEVEGVMCNFLHEIPVSGALYRGVGPDREMLWSALAGKEGKAPKCDLIVRSHAHYFVHVEHASKHGIVNPCWQLPYPWLVRKSAYRMMPDIGATMVYVDGSEKKAGRDPIYIEKFLYPMPIQKHVVAQAVEPAEIEVTWPESPKQKAVRKTNKDKK